MIDITHVFPDHGIFVPLEDSYADDPADALYTMRTRLQSGLLRADFSSSVYGVLLYKGRPLISIYQSDKELKFGTEALEKATETHLRENPKTAYKVTDIDPIILECFSALVSKYPVFRNFNPQILIIDELFDRMVEESFTGCINISTSEDYVILYVSSGNLLDTTKDGKISDRYPINESPVTNRMAKAVTLMSNPSASMDIYEVPENLYSKLATWKHGIPFKTPSSIKLLIVELMNISREELRGKSNFFDKKLNELGNNLSEIEDFCNDLEHNLDVQLSRRILKSFTERLLNTIAEFKIK
ncbi:MAG: hypothetical protein KAH30_04190 [Caldisericia bacterium]|nr:hypothetical protein [Caldisericia bacterium]